MRKLNNMPDYTAKIPKTPHDMSQSTGFTSPVGQISPVYYDMLHTGDELHFSASLFARLNPLTTAALGEIECHLDYFFVPLTVMYTPASSLFYETDDLISSIFRPNEIDPALMTGSFPTLNLNYAFPGDGDTWWSVFDGARSTQPSSYDSFITFDSVGKSIFRMWDFLDLRPYDLVNTSYRSIRPAFTPWFALAYQAIYNLYPQYRNFDREPKNYNYNIDRFWQSLNIEDISDIYNFDNTGFASIFQIRYANKPKDYFQSAKVSPMGSSVSMLTDPGTIFTSVNDWINSPAASILPVEADNSSGTFASATQTSVNPDGDSVNFTTGSIRQLFMVDKLLRVIGRAEKNYESQFLAHYGIKIPHDSMHNITHIGHDVAVLSPQPIISSANTFNGESGSALGEVGGQGSVMLRGRKMNFKAPFHGVFMVNAYFIPRQRVIAGLNKLHQLNSVNDFWQPEFDKKGMQPLFAYEVNPFDQSSYTDRLGWQFAYEQFKRKYDRISMAFAPSNTHNAVNTYSPWFISTSPFRSFDKFGSINDPAVEELYYENFKVAPTDLNGIMQVPYSTDWSASFTTAPWLIYQTDPLICDFNLYCKKVNGMSEYGEPEL